MNPFRAFFRTLGIAIAGRFLFDRNAAGKTITTGDGMKFTIFRRVEVVMKNPAKPEAVFLVRFRPSKMSPEANVRFSRMPMMIFMGFNGFRSKYWAVDYETGLCQGLYEWQTVADAKAYSESVAMRFMSKRSDPESVSFRLYDRSKEDLKFTVE